VRPYDELDYVDGCKELNADIFVISEDWDNKPHNLAVESYLESAGKQIKQVLYNPRTSSNSIKQHVRDQVVIPKTLKSPQYNDITKKQTLLNTEFSKPKTLLQILQMALLCCTRSLEFHRSRMS
jgi:hypothetical protein